MAEVLICHYAAYGNIETMIGIFEEGGRAAGVDVTIRRMPEWAPIDVARVAGFDVDQATEDATIEELPDYDAIIVATANVLAGCRARWQPPSIGPGGCGCRVL